MKKTFKELTVGDVFYRVRRYKNEFSELSIIRVDMGELNFGFGSADRIGRCDQYYLKTDNYYYFTSKEDVINYCKRQSVKILIDMIRKAKESIKEIRDFKLENYDILNKDWMEYEITLLEKQINQH